MDSGEGVASLTSAPDGESGAAPKSSADDKVMEDLTVLMEKIDVCNAMLRGDVVLDESGEALLVVVGFLEACAPRMVELVEAAAQGALSETSLERCLEVNDALVKVLSDCDTKDKPPRSGPGSVESLGSTASSVAAAAAEGPTETGKTPDQAQDDFDAFLLDRASSSRDA